MPAHVLRLLEPRSVFVQRARPGAGGAGAPLAAAELAALRPRFFFNLVPEVGVALSACCGRFFHAEDLELEVLKGGGACPLCGGAPSEE